MATTYPDISGASNMLNMINQYRALNPSSTSTGHVPVSQFAGEGVGGGVPASDTDPNIAAQLMSALFGNRLSQPSAAPQLGALGGQFIGGSNAQYAGTGSAPQGTMDSLLAATSALRNNPWLNMNPQMARRRMSMMGGDRAQMLRDLLMRRFGGTQRPDFRNIIGNTARPRPVFDNPWINRF